jgi:hypothetical protein
VNEIANESESESESDDEGDVVAGGSLGVELDTGEDADEINNYRTLCQQAGVIPARYYERHCASETFAMNEHGLGPRGAEALCRCLARNRHVVNLVSHPTQSARHRDVYFFLCVSIALVIQELHVAPQFQPKQAAV